MLRLGAGSRRTGTPADALVVGLGNPGAEYAGTRHNLGVEVVELLVSRHDGRLRSGKELALSGEVRIDGHLVAVAFPQTYMNDSGQSVVRLIRRHGIDDLSKLIVVHDELDLPVGRLQVKVGGGIAGHNGLRSLKEHLHSTDFVRVRIGVGKPPGRQSGADHVLRRPTKAERTELDVLVVEAADAVEAIVREGPEVAMNRFNGA
ncbi:MAG TPA: aminoacyl-tRNA hydrolase [Acidimicrobiales bacterium]|jgi:PTH1 family peptidyl-tRNA hydrolase|nr:aminoacyl-tRNA hydrolase [Acidimicrobiales bacterium]